jgi:hypothetical protein
MAGHYPPKKLILERRNEMWRGGFINAKKQIGEGE